MFDIPTGAALAGVLDLPRHCKRTGTLLCVAFVLLTQGSVLLAGGEPPTERDAIRISGNLTQKWREGDETVLLLRGKCEVQQAKTVLSAQQMIVWQRTDTSGRKKITAYLEEDARLDQPGRTLNEHTLMFDLMTKAEVTEPSGRSQATLLQDPLYQRALKRRTTARRTVQRPIQQIAQQNSPEQPILEAPGLAVPEQGGPGITLDPDQVPELRTLDMQQSLSSLRRVRVFPRSAVRFNVESFQSTTTTPPEQVWVFTGGINVLIDGVDTVQGTSDLSADRVIIWTQLGEDSDFTGEGQVQSREVPFQIYLEGNIVMRQGMNTLRASQAFYDARSEKALLLNAELKTNVKDFPQKIRVRGNRIRQVAKDTYQAERAFVTTSEFGVPGYKLQAKNLTVEPRPSRPFGLQGLTPPQIDPATGLPEDETELWFESTDNTFSIENVPLFYAPYLAFPAEDPNIPLRRITFSTDDIYGYQLYTTWNLYKLLGMSPVRGTRIDLHLDYLSKRGPEGGATYTWNGQQGLFGGQATFLSDSMAIYDTGRDNLGADRLSLQPGEDVRGRWQAQYREWLPNGIMLQGELGLLSDRNYLEQYNENVYDAGKDYETNIYARQHLDNWGWSVLGRERINDFYNETSWLPRGDLYGLGEPILGGALTWSQHSYVGYANQRIASAPTDPTDYFSVLPFEGNTSGVVGTTRHGIDAPFSLGPVQVVPYALGEASYWQNDYQGEQLNRLYGSAGVRTSIEFSRAWRNVHSDMFYLNGLAHKIVLSADYSFSESTQDLSDVPQLNEFDDNAQEQYRRRLLRNTFNGTLPPQFDPRFYALRSGAAHDVSSPFNELVGDQQVLRLSVGQRLQTKRGPLNAQRIVNWMTLDLDVSVYPDANRDNFGQSLGLYGARYTWNVGDRTTLLASTQFDTFDEGMKIWNLGINSQRSTRGSVYVGLRHIEGGGNLDSEIATASYSYQLSPKWITSVGAAYDLRERQNRGESFMITRVGADFLFHVGAVFDPNKNNVGFAFSFEPRFGNFGGTGGPLQLSSLMGQQSR